MTTGPRQEHASKESTASSRLAIPFADANTRKRFIESYEAKHGFEKEGSDKTTLTLGMTIGPSRCL